MEFKQRDLQFRCWSKKRNTFLNDFIIRTHDGPFPSTILTVDDGESDWINSGISDSSDYLLIQYTGLNDCEGNPIFEGDIIEISSETKQIPIEKEAILISHGIAGIKNNKAWLNPELPPCALLDILNNTTKHYIKIIGNLFENPELLEK